MKAILCILLLASAAFAFTTTHLVIVESTPLYEIGHPFDDEHILSHLGYWTELEATSAKPIVWRNVPYWQAYWDVTLENGAEGCVKYPDAGYAAVTVIDDAPVYPDSESNDIADTIDKGELVASLNIRVIIYTNRTAIRTKEKLDGWVSDDAVEPAYVYPPPPFNKYGEPREGPPQTARKR